MKREDITAVVFCGGAGRRLGGMQKPLIDWHGRPLVGHVIERLAGQVAAILLSTGADPERYARFRRWGPGDHPGIPGRREPETSTPAVPPASVARSVPCRAVPDETPGEGPLGGLAGCLEAVSTDWIFTCPGDSPRIAPDLVERLAPDAERSGVAVAHDGQRRQNLFLLIRRDRAEALVRFYREGGRAIHRWLEANEVEATELPDLADAFFNVNTPADLAALRAQGD